MPNMERARGCLTEYVFRKALGRDGMCSVVVSVLRCEMALSLSLSLSLCVFAVSEFLLSLKPSLLCR